MRIILLFALTIAAEADPAGVHAFGQAVSWRDIILFVGGLFLVVKATHEMHHGNGGGRNQRGAKWRRQASSFVGAMIQIAIIDLVFSIDSIITAIGMARDVSIMVTAVILSMIVMYVAAGPVSGFVHRHPTAKMLALAFLVLIGVALIGRERASADRPQDHLRRDGVFRACRGAQPARRQEPRAAQSGPGGPGGQGIGRGGLIRRSLFLFRPRNSVGTAALPLALDQ
jgi:hypothetical protein